MFSLDYGNRGLEEISRSAEQLKTFTSGCAGRPAAKKVSMVGHSQGGMMPRYYIKFLGGARYVDDLVGIAPSNHGTRVLRRPAATRSRTWSASSARRASSRPPARTSCAASTPVTRRPAR